MKIVIFGAGGFVGGSICEELSLRNDIEQVACVRKWASAVRLARRGIPLRQADLENTEQIRDIVAGADAVVNAAMVTSEREPELVSSLYAACVEARVPRFVQFSSAAVYGNRTGTVDEDVAPEPIDAYSRGKAEMESRLIRSATASDTQVIILRPSIVYGPFSDGWTVRYVERVHSGRWRGLGPAGAGICNLVHAQDVARATIAAATADIPPGIHVLNLNASEVVTWNEYIERLGDEMGLTDRVIPSIASFRFMATAARILRMGGGFAWARSLYRRSAGATRAVMTSAKGLTALYPAPGELQLLSRKVRYSANRASATLGVSPQMSLEAGIRQSIAWCRLHGLV